MRKAYAFTMVSLTAGMLVAFMPATGSAQGLMGRLKKKAEDAAKGKIEQRTDAAVDSAVNKVDCKVPGTKCDPAKTPATNAKTAEDAGADDTQTSSSESSQSAEPRVGADTDDEMFDSGKGYSVAKEGVTYRLTPVALKGFLAAGKKLTALGLSDPQAVAQATKTHVPPKVKAVFDESGITREEYFRFFVATFVALDYRDEPPDPTDKVLSSPVLRANLAFIKAHPKEFKELMDAKKKAEAEILNAIQGAGKK